MIEKEKLYEFDETDGKPAWLLLFYSKPYIKSIGILVRYFFFFFFFLVFQVVVT